MHLLKFTPRAVDGEHGLGHRHCERREDGQEHRHLSLNVRQQTRRGTGQGSAQNDDKEIRPCNCPPHQYFSVARVIGEYGG